MNPDGTAFTGNFYGNGHTIIIRGFAPGVTDNFGLFGVVGEGAVIRDLTVVYETADANGVANGGAVTVTIATANFGGIAGATEGNARFENVLVKGAVTVSTSGTNIGGMVGNLGGSSSITNAYSGINITINNITINNSGTNSIGGFVGNSSSTGTVREITGVGTLTVNTSGIANCGGIVGQISSTTTFHDCIFSGNISIPGGVTTLRLGGVVGYVRTAATIEKSIASGDLEYTGTSGNSIQIGGVVGLVIEGPSFIECFYENGKITVASSGSGEFNIGGFSGRFNEGSVSRCYSRAGSITASKTAAVGGNFFIGGFSGVFQNEGTISGCYSTSPVTVPDTHLGTDGVNAGGFAGYLSRKIVTNCYATGSVYTYAISTDTSLETNTQSTGGFVGVIINSAEISLCYAAGNVTAKNAAVSNTHGTGFAFNTGGFAGYASRPIDNSYATGSVLADRLGNTVVVSAGGFVGYKMSTTTIQNSFARGSVTARANGNSSGVYAGGFVGYKANGPLTNNAALGASVTATGGASQIAGRIFGHSVEGTNSGNRAKFSMRTGTSPLYTDTFFTTVTHGIDNIDNGIGAALMHGTTVEDSVFQGMSIWTTMGFTTTNWNFYNIVNGYPRLAWE